MMRKIRLLINTLLFILWDACYRRSPAEKNTILFLSDIRTEAGGNFKLIESFMGKKGYSCTSLFFPGKNYNCTFSEIRTLAKLMCRCEFILLEDYFHYTAYKRFSPRQSLCQIWHGAGAFKKFGYSRIETGDDIRIHSGYKKYTKAITSSPEINWCYEEAFGIDAGRVSATGIPDTDMFFDEALMEEYSQTFKNENPVINGRKIILFAPTYRAASQRQAGYDMNGLDLDALYKALHVEFVFAIKWHPAMLDNPKCDTSSYIPKEYKDFFLDVSHYRNINEILPAVDILVTDYSSVIFDYSLLDRPVVFYTADREDYADARGFYYDYKDYMYGPLASTTDELIKAINDNGTHDDERKAFRTRFMSSCDGRATEKTCEWIFGNMV